MRPDVRRDFDWSNELLPQIESILRRLSHHIVSFRIATPHEDLREATDYIVTVESGTIALRVRRPTNYRDFTIRTWRASGAKTEIDKLIDGNARWYLYAWTDSSAAITDWMFIDMDTVRARRLLEWARANRERTNTDGLSKFTWITPADLQTAGALVDASVTYTKAAA